MGRAAKGVKGISLGKKDECIAMAIVQPEETILTVTGQGFGKRTMFKEYRLQSRGGKGIINIKVTGKNGEAVGLTTVSDKDEIMLMTEKGMIVRCPIKDIRTTGRSTQGVRLMRLDAAGDKVASVAKIVPEDESEKIAIPAPAEAEAVSAAPEAKEAPEAEAKVEIKAEEKKEVKKEVKKSAVKEPKKKFIKRKK
jgi:DNA gyrase subunit A